MSNRQAITAASCPYCGYDLNDATGFKNAKDVPVSGDIGVCFKCSGVILYDDNVMAIVMPTTVWVHVDTDIKELINKAIKQIRNFRELQ